VDLVGEGAGGEAVAEDRLAGFQGRPDHGGDELGAGREKGEKLGPGRQRLVKKPSHEFARGGAAGFAGVEHGETPGFEAADNGQRRGGLAGAFAAFEDDEAAALSAQNRRLAQAAGSSRAGAAPCPNSGCRGCSA